MAYALAAIQAYSVAISGLWFPEEQSTADCSDYSVCGAASQRIVGYRSVPGSAVAARDARDGRCLSRNLRSGTGHSLALAPTINPSGIAGRDL